MDKNDYTFFEAPTPEVEKSKSILAMARAKNDELSMVGRRLVSEKEWEMLQLEVRALVYIL